MINIRKTLICIAAAAIAAVSCQKDDTLQYNNLTMGNIVEGKFVSDQGNIFNIVDQTCVGEVMEEKRAMVLCDVLNPTDGGAENEYDVRLTSYARVLEKDAVSLESAMEGDLAVQNPIHIEQLWFSGGYINMLIKYNAKMGSEVKHLVNLVYSKDEQGRYVLNFRHNAFGEVWTEENSSEMILGSGYVSFPITKFVKEDNAKLVFTWKWYKDVGTMYDYLFEKDYSFEYDWTRTGFEHKF